MIHTRILYSIFSVFIFSYVLSILKVQALVLFDANQEMQFNIYDEGQRVGMEEDEYVYNGKDEVASNKKYENDAEEDDEDEEEEEIPGFGGADTSYEDDEDCYEDTCNEDAYPGVQNVGLIGKVARTLSYFNSGGR